MEALEKNLNGFEREELELNLKGFEREVKKGNVKTIDKYFVNYVLKRVFAPSIQRKYGFAYTKSYKMKKLQEQGELLKAEMKKVLEKYGY